MTMVPGKVYRGHAFLNEYGQVIFTPEQKGSKPTNMKLVMEHDVFSLYESPRLWKVAVKFEKVNFSLAAATNRLLLVVSLIKNYIR